MKTLIAIGKVAALFSSPLLLGLYVYDRSGGNVSSWFSPVAPPSEAIPVTSSRQPEKIAVAPTEPMWGSAPDESAAQAAALVSRLQSAAATSDTIYAVKPASTSGPLDVTIGQTPAAVLGADGRIAPFIRQYDSRSMLTSTKSAVLTEPAPIWKRVMPLEPAAFSRLLDRDPIPSLGSKPQPIKSLR